MEEENITLSKGCSEKISIFGLFENGLQISTKSTNDDQSDLTAFLKENYNKKISLLTQHNYAAVKRPLIVIFHQFEFFNELKRWTDLWHKVASSPLFEQERIEFSVADFRDLPIFQTSWDDLDYFGFDADMPPYIFAVDKLDHQFQYEVIKYVKELIDNKLWQTQPIPEEMYDTDLPNVKTIVASNFKERAFGSDKDVVVTFHSNYSFQYRYNLGGGAPEELKRDAENLVFYNYNAQENYLPLEYKIRNFPTSMLIPRNAKNKLLFYDHSKTNDCYYSYWYFLKFLTANVTNEPKLYERSGYLKDFEALKQKQLVNFLKEHYDEEIKTLTSRNYYNFVLPFIVFYHAFNDTFLELKEWTDLLHALKQQFPKIQFLVADFDTLSHFSTDLDELSFFDVNSSLPPCVFAVDISRHQFQYDGPVKLDALTKYCEQLVNNQLFKTESVPDEKEDFKKVNKLVANDFWLPILEHEKEDVLVTFHKSSPIWESCINQAMKELRCDLDKFVFYKFDAEANYLPLDLKMHEFPTTILIPSNDKCKRFYFNHLDHLVYDNFTHPYYEDFMMFLAKNSSTELTFWDRKGQRKGAIEDSMTTDDE